MQCAKDIQLLLQNEPDIVIYAIRHSENSNFIIDIDSTWCVQWLQGRIPHGTIFGGCYSVRHIWRLQAHGRRNDIASRSV